MNIKQKSDICISIDMAEMSSIVTVNNGTGKYLNVEFAKYNKYLVISARDFKTSWGRYNSGNRLDIETFGDNIILKDLNGSNASKMLNVKQAYNIMNSWKVTA